MSIETGGNLSNRVEKSAEVSERQDLEQEFTPEQMEEASRVILDSLALGEEENLDDFEEKLIETTKSLPRYQEIEQKLEGVDTQNLPYELFKVLKKRQIQQNWIQMHQKMECLLHLCNRDI